MAKKSSATFAKRQREIARKEKRQHKLEKRAERQKKKEERVAAGLEGAPVLEMGPDGEFIDPYTDEAVGVGVDEDDRG